MIDDPCGDDLFLYSSWGFKLIWKYSDIGGIWKLNEVVTYTKVISHNSELTYTLTDGVIGFCVLGISKSMIFDASPSSLIFLFDATISL